jgi:hypothetical protein
MSEGAESEDVSESKGEEQPSGFGSNLPRLLGALAGVFTALAALIGVLKSCSPEPSHSSSVPPPPGASSVVTAAATPPERAQRRLLWVPSDCAGDTTAAVAIDSCGDKRTLEWLKLEMDRLRKEAKFGFAALPARFTLVPSDYGDSGINFRLSVRRAGESDALFAVGVGYSRTLNVKDGALRLYHPGGALVAEAWLQADGTWSDGKVP